MAALHHRHQLPNSCLAYEIPMAFHRLKEYVLTVAKEMLEVPWIYRNPQISGGGRRLANGQEVDLRRHIWIFVRNLVKAAYGRSTQLRKLNSSTV